MQLLYGTYNPAKLAMMKRHIGTLDVQLIALSDLAYPPPDVEETGVSPLENARLKATAYCKATGHVTLSADSGLYIDGLADAQQPGEHARRMQGARMDDEAMIGYYASLAASLGGKAVARYRNALCIAFPDGRTIERFDESVASRPFYLVEKPHAKRAAGFPLDSLSVDIESGQYYHDLGEGRLDGDLAQESGYCRFIRDALGL